VDDGRNLVLKVLFGKSTERIPSALFTHLWEYAWKIANMQPWELACGDINAWHTLLREDSRKWIVSAEHRKPFTK